MKMWLHNGLKMLNCEDLVKVGWIKVKCDIKTSHSKLSILSLQELNLNRVLQRQGLNGQKSNVLYSYLWDFSEI